MIRNYSRRQPGQSLPLIVVMLVVIIGMVGLSVDAGNAYGQQRRVQNIANAGAIAAMSSAVRNNTNKVVWEQVDRTVKGNRVDFASGNYDITAHYITTTGTQELGSQYGLNQATVAAGSPPKNVERIQVTVTERVGTYFARMVGRKDLTVNANGSACLSGIGPNTYPIGIPLSLTRNFHEIKDGGSTLTPASNPQLWSEVESGNWKNMEGKDIVLPFANSSQSTQPPGTFVGWLNWGMDNGASALGNSMAYPGNLLNGFREANPPSGENRTQADNQKLEELDWVQGKTGVSFSQDVTAALQDHKTSKRIIILPMYQKAPGGGSSTAFYVTAFYKFRVTNFNTNGNNSYLQFRYVGEATDTVTNCSGEPPFTVQARKYNVEGVAKVNRVWRVKSTSPVTHDIVLVMDTSGSMNFDWYDRRPASYMDTGKDEAGYDAANARINDAKRVVKDFVRNYDVATDPDARIALWTFGGEGSINDATELQDNWTTSGCTTAQITATPTLCTPDKKWQSIQDNANALSAQGGTPGPFAFQQVIKQLQSAQETRNGKPVRKVVIFATDGVFNICGSDPNTASCPKGDDVCPDQPFSARESCRNDPKFQSVQPRPIWQAQRLSNQVKGLGASIYMVAMEPSCVEGAGRFCFDPYGLPEMSSGSGYYFSAKDSASLNTIYDDIRKGLVPSRCEPQEREELAKSATVRITRPGDPSFSRPAILSDSVEATYRFENLEAGTYAITVDPWAYKSPEDNLSRTYSRVRNGLNLGEEGKSSVLINPQFPSGSTVYSRVLISLPLATNGLPHNGCTMP